MTKDSLLVCGGSWKSFEDENVDKAELLRRVESSLGLGAESISEGCSMTELNTMMICGGHERFPISPVLEPLVFDESLMSIPGAGHTGMFGLLDPFALCEPGFFSTGDQVERVFEDCTCGRPGDVLKGEIRSAPEKEVKGCGGILASVKA